MMIKGFRSYTGDKRGAFFQAYPYRLIYKSRDRTMISVKINISYTLKKNQFRNTRCKTSMQNLKM